MTLKVTAHRTDMQLMRPEKNAACEQQEHLASNQWCEKAEPLCDEASAELSDLCWTSTITSACAALDGIGVSGASAGACVVSREEPTCPPCGAIDSVRMIRGQREEECDLDVANSGDRCKLLSATSRISSRCLFGAFESWGSCNRPHKLVESDQTRAIFMQSVHFTWCSYWP